ncbi:phosphoenolpyruvate synthase regulatory protein, partial [Kluyvera ascorbata]
MTDLASASSSRTPFRTVYIVSDGTGITAETFSHSILAQFEMKFRQVRIPFVDTIDKAHVAVAKINEAFHAEGV